MGIQEIGRRARYTERGHEGGVIQVADVCYGSVFYRLPSRSEGPFSLKETLKSTTRASENGQLRSFAGWCVNDSEVP